MASNFFSVCSIAIMIVVIISLEENAAAQDKMAEQRKALLALKAGFVDSSVRLQDWSDAENGSPCSWTGVSCDPSLTKVVTLNLSNMNLTGNVSESIQGLRHLLELNISRNLFSDALPAAFFNLTEIRTLDINHNDFNGNLPPGISKLKNLVNFNAFSNGFSGPLPVELVELRHLEEDNLAGSYFEGSIPLEYGDFGSSLKFLYLSGNSITGPIPPELGRLQNLRHLEIGYNSYSGGIPPELGNMTELEYLDISGANLTGVLPQGIFVVFFFFIFFLSLLRDKPLESKYIYNNTSNCTLVCNGYAEEVWKVNWEKIWSKFFIV